LKSERKGLSAVYGFIVIFTLLMAGIGAALTIMDSQASVWSAQDRARQIQASQQAERLALSLNGSSLTIRNVGLAPSQVLYLYQKGVTTSTDRRLGASLQEGSNLTTTVARGMLSFAVITSLGNVFWVYNSTQTQLRPSTVSITFDASGLDTSFGSATVLSVDGSPYAYSSLPKTFEWPPSSRHNYSYTQGFATGSGSRIGWSSARGLSTTFAGTVIASQPGIIVSTYTQQHLLTVTGGTAVQFVGSPSNDGWYDTGSTGQFRSGYVWNTSAGSRQNLYTYSLDGSSAVSVPRSGSGAYTSIGIAMSAPHAVALSPMTQYQLAVSGGNSVTFGGSQTGDGWFDSGTLGTATTAYVWNLTAGQSRLNLVSWNLDGGTNQVLTRAGSGTYTTTSIAMNAFHTVGFNSATQYSVTVRSNVTGSGSLGALTVGYSYFSPPTTLSSGPQNPGFESGSLTPWYVDSGSVAASAGITTTNPHSGSYAAYIHLQNGNCWAIAGCQGQLDQVVYSLPSNAIVTSISGSVWYYVSNTSWETGSIFDNCGGGSPAGSAGAWTQLTYSWSGSCRTSSVSLYLAAGEGSQAANYYTYFDDATMSITYTTPVSGSTSSSPNSFSVNGTAVRYTYGVGYAFSVGSTSTSWSTVWPSTESYSSSTCTGATISGTTISGTSGGLCTLVTTRSGSYSASGTSPTGDGWYDAGSSVQISAAVSGPFAFSAWSSSSSSLLPVTSSKSASTTVQVNTYGTVTASFSAGQ
jgi:hypothetical protein